jgi:glycosidase
MKLGLIPSLGGAVLVAAAVSAPLEAAAPRVTKVEPPNWWAGHSIDPVRVLVRGEGFSGARVEAVGAGLTAGPVRVNAAGTYLFVDVSIDKQAAPGPRTLRVTTSDGVVDAPFEISAPLPRAGRFQGFSSDDVMYLLMPDRFANGDPSNDDPPESKGLLDRAKGRYYHGGDFKGIVAKLPYLKSLGVTALWMNPIYDNVDHINEKEKYDGQAITDYHGYGAVDFYGVEERFGTLDDFRRLVDAAHAAGIKVIQDQVANHTGPYHPWVQDPPTPTWYNGTADKHLDNTWQIWTLADPYATPEMRKATLEGWFVNILPDLNQNDEEVRRYLIQNTLWWIGVSGLDGIRQDTLPYAPRDFWRDWTAAIRREHPRLQVVGEMWDGDPVLLSFFQGGRARFDGVDSGIGALFDFPLYYPLRRAFAEGEPLREVAKMLARDRLYEDPQALVTFLGSHDVDRFMNQKGADATGLRQAFTLLFTVRGIPLVYYGDEIALAGGNDPDNRRDFPGGFPGDARNAFTAAGRTAEEQAVFAHVQKLARLRAELPALRRGTTVQLGAGEQSYCFARTLGAETVVVALNNAKQAATVECAVRALELPEGAAFDDRLGGIRKLNVAGAALRVELPARSGAVLTRRP